MQSNDSRIERYYSMNGYMRVSMDFKHGYVLVGDGNGAAYIMTLADLKNGSYNIKYTFSIFNYGYEASQTYQSQTLDFPYVYWDFGDIDLHDNRMLYGVNVVHGGQEFAMNLMLDMDFKTADDVMEPETVKAIYDSTGNSALLLTFNCWVNDNPIERVYSLPIKTRQAADTLNTSTTDDNTAD